MDGVVGAAGSALLLLGLALASVGLYGMFRKPTIFEQLHAAGLVTGPGVILILLASLASGSAEIATSALLVVVFVLVMSSLSTHAIALAAWHTAAAATATAGPLDRHSDVSAAAAPRSAALRVLLAHDGSPGADVATSLVASLPWAEGSQIRVIRVIDGDLRPLSATDPAGEVDRPEPVDADLALEPVVRRLVRPGVAVAQVTRRGDPGMTIVHEADRFRADLVVVGSRGLGALRALVVGSVAAEVLDSAPCPVLVARGPGMTRVLLATDGSAPSAGATAALARWPIFEDVPIHVLNVATAALPFGDPAAGGGMRAAVETSGDRAIANAAAMILLDAGRRATASVESGDAVTRIRAFAVSQSIDLIVVGSRGNTGLKRAVLGSSARGVLSSTMASVLVVRP